MVAVFFIYSAVHDFIIKYQDRLLYGTYTESYGLPEEKKRAHEIWLRDWIYSINARRVYLRNQKRSPKQVIHPDSYSFIQLKIMA